MAKRKRETYVSNRARELAASGVHLSTTTIISALVEEGYREAQDLLGDPIVRDYLDKMCAAHWPVLRPVISADLVIGTGCDASPAAAPEAPEGTPKLAN